MLPQLNYVHIDEQPSTKILAVLLQETTVHPGGSYLALGLIGMQDAIVIVDSDGKVITLPYDENSFTFD